MIDRPVLLAIVAVLLNAGAGYGAWHRESVTAGGGVTGAVVGAVILFAGGFTYWIMLMLFFVSSSLASRLGSRRKERLERMHEKGSRRDAVQVMANGGAAAAAVIALRITGAPVFALAAAGAFASVNADTWASELGVLARRPPRSIVTWRQLEPGTSGGVSLPGTVAAAAGSLLIAVWFALTVGFAGEPVDGAGAASLGRTAIGPAAALLVVWLAGFVGTTTDSVLGATVQALYRDEGGAITERRRGPAGFNERVRGIPFVTNDVVNAVSSIVAAVAAGYGGSVLGA
ncbi:MAG: DUF92 domain-containing protein [Spirochaetota bacterium]